MYNKNIELEVKTVSENLISLYKILEKLVKEEEFTEKFQTYVIEKIQKCCNIVKYLKSKINDKFYNNDILKTNYLAGGIILSPGKFFERLTSTIL